MIYQIFKKDSASEKDSFAKMVARYGSDHLYEEGEIFTLESKNGPVRLKILSVEKDYELSRVFNDDFYHVYVLILT